MDTETSSQITAPVARRGQFGRLSLFVVIALTAFIFGSVGGVMGFVALSNSSAPGVKSLRKQLGLGTDASVSVPVAQTLKLSESSAVIDASAKVMPAVVAITTTTQVQDFFGRVMDSEGEGSGFILTSDGLIVTNKHVVEGGGSFTVVLNDGRSFPATVQSVDPFNDLAVIKVEAKDLPVVELGESDSLKVGQTVLAIGNQLGRFKNSVTQGIVSAKERSLGEDGEQSLTDLIQTDASINQGNSGGPLVNLAGQVVGINTAIASQNGGSVGLGFAISIDSVRGAISSVQKTGTIQRPYLGVRHMIVTKELVDSLKLSVDHGAIIARGSLITDLAVSPGSPAEKAGLKENDIITEVNGLRVDEKNGLRNRLRAFEVGEEITLSVKRGSEPLSIKVTLEALK